MAYLHIQGVFDRDLKARNVLVHEYSNSLHTKVTDFGAPNMLMFIKNCTKWEPLLKDVNVNSNKVLNDQMKRANFDQVENFPRIN